MEKLSYTVHEVGGHESKDEKLIRTSQHVNKPYQMGLSRSGHDYLIIRGESGGLQRAKKVVSDSPGIVDFVIRLVKSVFNLSDGQAGLSLRAGGRGFSLATKRVAPSYFYWKIEEK